MNNNKLNEKPLQKYLIYTKLNAFAKSVGFTLAEIIISMTIIGIIAVITIPALLVSTNEKVLEAQKRALLARMSQAMSQIEDLRVYKSLNEDGTDKSSATNFITKALSKVYRITKICDKNSLSAICGFPEEIATQNGSIFKIKDNSTLVAYINNADYGDTDHLGGVNTNVAGFKTANGESIALFYNPKCRGKSIDGFYSGNAASSMCLNMLYDLNGKDEAPNEVGKDIGFLTVFFPQDPDIVAPVTYITDATNGTATTFTNKYKDAISACKKQENSLIIPTWSEGMSIALNKQLSNIADSGLYLVSGAGKIDGAYEVNSQKLLSTTTSDWSDSFHLRCIYNK